MENIMSKLNDAISEIANLPNSDKVNIKGKYYTTVDTRVHAFRKHLGEDAQIATEVIHHDDTRVVVKATVSVCIDGELRVLGNDYAEEYRAAGMVNKTSALENCCTSAIGRALACCGLGGGEYASAFEVDNAINNKAEAPKAKEKTKGKYKIESDNKAVVINTDDEEKYLHHLRTFLADPASEECKRIFKLNKDTIIKAQIASTNGTKEAYDKLLEIYNEA
jgi:hypothetical protein